MESTDILIEAKTNSETTHDWIILPLVRGKLVLGIVGWCFGILLGFVLFIGLASVIIPANYQRGIPAALFSTLVLGIMLFIALGSLWSLITDVRRLMQLDKHIIVITPEDFVKQEGEKIIHVPLAHVRYVTARGAVPVNRDDARERGTRQMPRAGAGVLGIFIGHNAASSGTSGRRKRARTPTTLAFIDTRSDNEVTVVTDGAYGDPFMIAALLKQYATNVQSIA